MAPEWATIPLLALHASRAAMAPLGGHCGACETNFEGPASDFWGGLPMPEGVKKSGECGRAPEKNLHPDVANLAARSRMGVRDFGTRGKLPRLALAFGTGKDGNSGGDKKYHPIPVSPNLGHPGAPLLETTAQHTIVPVSDPLRSTPCLRLSTHEAISVMCALNARKNFDLTSL